MKILYLALALALAGCSVFGGPAATPTVEMAQVTSTPTALPPLLVLLAPSGSDPEISATAAELASTFASSHAMQFQQLDRLSPGELPSNLSILVILAPDPGAADLAAAASSARVITIGFAADGANVQSLSASQAGAPQVAFVAGYTAEIMADDWRAGMLYTPASQDLANDFIAGGRYFCGNCVPEGPPYTDYPQTAQAADATQWQAAADELIAQSVKVVYLVPELEGSGVEQYLAAYGMLLIGSAAPLQGVEANWVTGISADAAGELREQLPHALAGETFQAGNSLTLVNPNPTYLSDAKLSYIQIVINDLLNGYILLSNQP